MFKTLPWAPRRSQVVPKNFKIAGTWPQAGPNRACTASPFLRVSLPPVGPQNCPKIASRWLQDGPNRSQDGHLDHLDARFGASCHRLTPCLPMLGHVGTMLACVEAVLADVGICWGLFCGHVSPCRAYRGAILAYIAPLLGLCWPSLRVIVALVRATLPILCENGVLSKNGVLPRRERHFGAT